MNPILESCKKDIAIKYGCTDWDKLMEKITYADDMLMQLDIVVDELTDLYMKRLKTA